MGDTNSYKASGAGNITFLISTINDGIYNVRSYQDVLGAKFVIVHQYDRECDLQVYRDYVLSAFDERFQYFTLKGRGLSRSRNYALGQCQTRYAYILDDDVDLHPKAVDIVLKAFESCHAAVVAFPMVKFFEDESFDDRISLHKIKFLQLAKVRSVEMALDLSQFKERFDESFGLGTDLPSGEEFIILSDAHQRGGGIYSADVSIAAHSNETSGLDFYSSSQKVRAKSLMFRRVTGKRFSLLFWLFLIKKFPVILSKRRFLFFMRHYFSIIHEGNN